MRTRLFPTGLAVLTLLALAPTASAEAPERGTTIAQVNTTWTCPGRDPRERATTTTRETRFVRRDGRSRVTNHIRWRGWIRHRETGELIRDDGTWTETYYLQGRRVLRSVATGVVWKLTIPGHGIVVHQAGRREFVRDGEPTETPFGGFPNLREMCRYV